MLNSRETGEYAMANEVQDRRVVEREGDQSCDAELQAAEALGHFAALASQCCSSPPSANQRMTWAATCHCLHDRVPYTRKDIPIDTRPELTFHRNRTKLIFAGVSIAL